MKKIFPLLSIALFLGLQTMAFACPEGKGGRGGPLKELDANKDEQLSADEVKDSPLADKFTEIDTDKNGQLTRDELKAHRKAHRPDRPKDVGEPAAQ
ncbi:MAG: EF-hand domain-containing protein [Proteobacteria bacterium]|nr:MAG: EF-hand domain-containing protein [Pseudomonadota bacterium]